jgi:hypothetical protein
VGERKEKAGGRGKAKYTVDVLEREGKTTTRANLLFFFADRHNLLRDDPGKVNGLPLEIADNEARNTSV